MLGTETTHKCFWSWEHLVPPFLFFCLALFLFFNSLLQLSHFPPVGGKHDLLALPPPTRQLGAVQCKAILCQARQGKTMQCKAMYGKARQCKSSQGSMQQWCQLLVSHREHSSIIGKPYPAKTDKPCESFLRPLTPFPPCFGGKCWRIGGTDLCLCFVVVKNGLNVQNNLQHKWRGNDPAPLWNFFQKFIQFSRVRLL